MAETIISGVNKPLSPIVFGTAQLTDTARSRQLLDDVYSCGCRTFDTARAYAEGQSEICLGRWLRDSGVSRTVTIITKCGHPAQRSRLRYCDLIYDLEASAEALGTDRFELVLLHRDDPRIPVDEIVHTVNSISRTHNVGAFGVSNWGVDRLSAAQQYAATRGLDGFRLSSAQFSLAVWTAEPWPGCKSIAGPCKAEDREWYKATQLPFMAWSSLAGGFFSETGTNSNGSRGSAHRAKDVYRALENLERRRRAATLGEKKGATTPQIALAYVLSQPLNIVAAISTHNVSHVQENLRAVDVELSDAERRWLNLEIDDPSDDH